MKNYVVYILYSESSGRYYIGHTGDMASRLHAYNLGKVRSTKTYRPWKIVYTEKKETKQEAYSREIQIKSFKGGEAFKEILFQSNAERC